MKKRPILFNGEMVQAILDGRKTQTRRICKKQPVTVDAIPRYMPNEWGFYGGDFPHHGVVIKCPYGQPGDRLWVREAFTKKLHPDAFVIYRADFPQVFDDDGDMVKVTPEEIKWTPSIHMFREDSRITLEITNVRVERLQDISEQDARAEGCDIAFYSEYQRKYVLAYWQVCRHLFKELWNKINGPGAWEKNPWVWVIEFKKA